VSGKSPRKGPKRKKTKTKSRSTPAKLKGRNAPVSLKDLAEHLGLSQTTVSVVLNESPVADSIRTETKERIFAAARKLGYRPNFMARSLRRQRSHTVGVLVPQISAGYPASLLEGIEETLVAAGFIYFAASHQHDAERIREYPALMMERSVEGLIYIDTEIDASNPLPAVAIAGRQVIEGVTNVVLDQRRAVHLALEHLHSLGHRRVAFMRGQPFSTDSHERWELICQLAPEYGIAIYPELVMRLEAETGTPQVGYPVMKQFLAKKPDFTALFAYNDISAIGAIRALADEGLRVPQDVSVVGFDDIDAAAFHTPSLTTIRQPLVRMGSIAAEMLLERLSGTSRQDVPKIIAVEPELIVRESTGPAKR
jgi:DNA-binding LacI/PurR family transcriptional regulator